MSYVIVYLPDSEIIKPLLEFKTFCDHEFPTRDLAEHAICENRVLRCHEGMYLNSRVVANPLDPVPHHLLAAIELTS